MSQSREAGLRRGRCGHRDQEEEAENKASAGVQRSPAGMHALLGKVWVDGEHGEQE